MSESVHGREQPFFVGRARELAILDAAFADADAANGNLVLVAGEPGIGKTCIAERFAAQARERGACVLLGRCWEYEGAAAYWPWVQVLRAGLRGRDAAAVRAVLGAGADDLGQLLPEVRTPRGRETDHSPAESPHARFRLFECVLAALRRVAGPAPLVVVLDDLQGADLPSLLLLEFVANSLPGLRALVVGTYRTSGVDAERPLVQRLPELTRAAGTSRLDLRGLSRDEVAAYARYVLDAGASEQLIDTLFHQSEGNPLFLAELARTAERGMRLSDLPALNPTRVPAGVQQVINRHLVRLASHARQVLQAASVLGREFSVDVLGGITDEPSPVLVALLDEAVAAQVLLDESGDGTRYRFTHALMRDVLYAELAGNERVRLHDRAAAVLATCLDAKDHLAAIAYHLMEATRVGADYGPAVDYARRAGDAALSVLAFEEAERLYRMALDTLQRHGCADTRLHTEVLLALGDARNRSGQIESAKEVFQRAAESAGGLGDRELLSHAALGYGGGRGFPESGHRDEDHIALLERAIAAWGTDDDPLHARLLGQLAISLYFTDAAQQRAALCERGLAMARRLHDAATLADVLLATHAATWGPNPHERLAIADELLRLAHGSGNRVLVYSAHHWRLCDVLDLGDRTAVDAELAACRSLAADLRQPHQAGWVQIFGCMVDTLEGRFDSAERAVSEILARGQWLGRTVETIFAIELFTLRHLQGRHEELIDPIRAAVSLNPGVPAMQAGLALLYAHAGRPVEARAEAAPLVEAIDDIPWGLNVIPLLAHLAEVCALIGDTQGAAIVHERLRAYGGLSFTIGNGVAYLGSVAHYLGLMEAALGHDADAARHFEDALSAHGQMRARPWVALAQGEYGALLVRTRDAAVRQRGATLLNAALDTARTLGMAGLEKKVCGVLSLAFSPENSRDPSIGSERTPATPNLGLEPAGNLFRRDGEFWTVAYGGRVVRLKDTKGVQYIAQLIAHPGRAFPVLDLVGGATGAIGGARTARTDSERARLAVTKRIKDALTKIHTAHPALGSHLRRSISTGYACVYEAGTDPPTSWQV